MAEQSSTRQRLHASVLSSRGLVLAAAMTAIVLTATEGSIVATAMPTIVAHLGGFPLFSWAFAAFLLTQAVSIPIYGRLADLHGRKPVFFAGTSLFLAASLLCGLAWSMGSFILFRALQGIGAGAIQPIATTIVGDIYTPEERAAGPGLSLWCFRRCRGPRAAARRLHRRACELVLCVLDQPADRRGKLCDARSFFHLTRYYFAA